MIPDITHYDARRNRFGNPKTGRRQPSGRKSRALSAPEYMVYFIRIDGGPFLKVGRTGDFATRIITYETASGARVLCYGQIMVGSLDASVRVENIAIKTMAALYKRQRREWFAVPLLNTFDVINAVMTAAGDLALSLRGGCEDVKENVLSGQFARDANSSARDSATYSNRVRFSAL